MNSATGLGGAWTDEDGNHNVVVGDGWQAKVVSNEEIIWTSDSLIGPITALIRVPYNDGAQIVVAALEPLRQGGESYGHLYRFGGDDFELFSDVQLLGTGLGEDNGEFDNRKIARLLITPEMLNSEEHPVLAAWKTFQEATRFEFQLYPRHSGLLGIITDDTLGYIRGGIPDGLGKTFKLKDLHYWLNTIGMIGIGLCQIDLPSCMDCQ